jgi:hypothetical protein
MTSKNTITGKEKCDTIQNSQWSFFYMEFPMVINFHLQTKKNAKNYRAISAADLSIRHLPTLASKNNSRGTNAIAPKLGE